MQPDFPRQSTVLEYGRAPKRARWRTPLAIALAVPTGLFAGWWTDTNIGGWVAVVFFAVIGPLCLELLTLRCNALSGLLFCVAMSVALLRGSMEFYARIGNAYTTGQMIKGFTLAVVFTWLVSLIAIGPVIAAKRRAAQPANAMDRAGG
jgi:hypothetical protein